MRSVVAARRPGIGSSPDRNALERPGRSLHLAPRIRSRPSRRRPRRCAHLGSAGSLPARADEGRDAARRGRVPARGVRVRGALPCPPRADALLARVRARGDGRPRALAAPRLPQPARGGLRSRQGRRTGHRGVLRDPAGRVRTTGGARRPRRRGLGRLPALVQRCGGRLRHLLHGHDGRASRGLRAFGRQGGHPRVVRLRRVPQPGSPLRALCRGTHGGVEPDGRGHGPQRQGTARRRGPARVGGRGR